MAYLSVAVRRGDMQVVARLLAAGADPDVKDLDGDAPLHITAEQCRSDLAELLLKHGADPNARDRHGFTSLHIAVWVRCGAVVEPLLRHGADPNARDAGGRTPLHRAADEGCADVAELLLDYGADPNVVDRGGWTPLHLVDIHVDLLEILLSRGAYPDVANPGGEAAIITYAMNGYVDEVAVLLDHGAHSEAKDGFLRTPAFYAAEGGHVDVLHLLLDRGAEVTLREAALIGDVYLAEELLKQGADPNEQDISGRTPLHYAFWAPEGGWRCRVEVAELLLKHGADPNARDKDGKTPLHYAVAHRHSDAVKLLLEYGAEVDEELAEALRLTPLHLAASRGSVEEVERLLSRDGDPNARDVFGRTPLHYAAARNRKAVAELLLKHGADPNAKDESGKTPLDLAVRRCAVDVLELLLPHAGDVDAVAEKASCLAVLRRLGFETPVNVRRRCEPYVARALKADVSFVESVLRVAAYAGCGEVASVLRRRFPAEVVRRAAFKLVGLSPPEELQLQDLRERCIRGSTAWLLLSRGVDPNTRDVHGLTLLHAAV
jgi:cytohesin